jgi:hypothetical protein
LNNHGLSRLFLHFLLRKESKEKPVNQRSRRTDGGNASALFTAIPPLRNEYSGHFHVIGISLRINPGQVSIVMVSMMVSITAAIGAIDIRPHVDSCSIGHHRQ